MSCKGVQYSRVMERESERNADSEDEAQWSVHAPNPRFRPTCRKRAYVVPRPPGAIGAETSTASLFVQYSQHPTRVSSIEYYRSSAICAGKGHRSIELSYVVWYVGSSSRLESCSIVVADGVSSPTVHQSRQR